MPLTPADVHNVAFSKPPIGKRGYNEDEVDAFLDLVQNEMTRLIENASGKDTETEAARARVLASAQEKADALQKDAERKHSEIMTTINQQRTVLEGRLEQLRVFEREYRTRLKVYLESQLEELGRVRPAVSASRGELEGSIKQLQSFARDYRERLKTYLESQLEELGQRDSDAPAKPDSPPNTLSEADAHLPPNTQSGTKVQIRSTDAALVPGAAPSQAPTVSSSTPTSGEADAPTSGIFISYRRDDERSFAGRLYDRLLRQFGEDQIFMDVDSIELGLDFTDVIEDRLGQCRVMLVVMGRHWLDCSAPDGERRLDNPDDFVRLEVETALARQDVRVIPVLVDDAVVPKSSDLPPSLSKLVRRNAIRMSHEGFGADFGRLVNTLERVMTA